MAKKPDLFEKTDKKLYFVYGYAQTGSASLTFPEDFDFVGLFESYEDTKTFCDKKNAEILEEEGINIDSEDEDEREDEISDSLADAGAYQYEVDTLDVLKLK